MKYVLISPARNEEKNIQKTLDSVCSQTCPPERWVIVDDGSKDRTAEIVRGYTARYPWIELVQRPQQVDRSFAAKVQAFNTGYERVKGLNFDVIGNLDADISFDPDYFEFLMRKLSEDPRLGLVGTPFVEKGYDSATDSFEGENYVAGGCQMFRTECFNEIGGYYANKAGGIDWIAVMTTRMKGWKVHSFAEKRFHHYRTLGTAEKSQLGALVAYGERAYYLGGSPIWQIFRGVYRIAKRPYVFGGLALLFGYFSASLRRMDLAVTPELMRFNRQEQMKKLKSIFRSLLTGKRIDNFRVATEQKS